MILSSIAIASALAASSHGTANIQQPAHTTTVVAQVESIGGLAQLIPASIAAPSAVFAIFGPAVLRRARPNRTERRVQLQPLPQNYMYYPSAR